MVMTLFVGGTVLLLGSGIPGLFTCRAGRGGERIALAMVLAGASLGGSAVVTALAMGQIAAVTLPWAVPGGSLSLALDGISAVFLLPVYLITALGALYGLGYWPQQQQLRSGRRLRLFYGVIAAALTVVMAAADGILFLVAWEIMALAGFFLVTTEEHKAEARRAGFIYLVATHIGTLALFAMFVLLENGAGSFAFPAAGTLATGAVAATAIFLLGLFGFGIKAGLMPLHIWLPGAHAAAPSHVSALLSGVMIKSGIYGLVRLTGFFADIPSWWGWLVLFLGASSGIMGVAFAIAQHDIKRLLAYHSVENIGIIALGLGTALLGRTYDLPVLVVLGLAGALLHVVNHGLFKSLLFLGAGAVIHASGSRELNHYGGLLRSMPWTGLFFLGGAVAISGLPPLNGFVSEWFIYLGLFKTIEGDALGVRLAVFALPALALIGALALACFVKVFGVTFLGAARTPAAGQAHEAPITMLAPMGILLLCCALIGIFPGIVLPLLSRAVSDWSGADVGAAALFAQTAPVGWISVSALFLLLLLGLVALYVRRSRQGKEVASAPTWGCGYAFPTARMQYTASSFADLLTGLFRWGLRPEQHGGHVNGTLPAASAWSTHTPDTVLDRLLIPLLEFSAKVSTWLRARLQNGSMGLYLLYIAGCLGFFLFAILLRG
jgi:hydrogenase-4 component B